MRTVILSILFIFINACSSNKFDSLNHSDIGYIGDYSKFEKVQTNDGLKTFRYASDKIKSGTYDKIIIAPVAFYPEEVTSAQISSNLLKEVKSYIDKNLIEAAQPHLTIVEKSQENAFVLTPRISAIKITSGDIKVMELIPIGSVIALGKEAAGYRHQNVEIYMEIKGTDSVDGEFIGGSVKQGKVGDVAGSNEVVTFESI